MSEKDPVASPAVPAPAGNGVRESVPFVYLTEHDMRELAMPASSSRSGITIYRVAEHNGETLHPLYATPVSAEEDGLRAAEAKGFARAIAIVEKHSDQHCRECGVYDYSTNVIEFSGAAEDVDGAYQDLLTDLNAARAALAPTPAESASVASQFREALATAKAAVEKHSTQPAESAPSGDTVTRLLADLRDYAGRRVGSVAVPPAFFGSAASTIAELEASLAQERSKREEAAENERDRLLDLARNKHGITAMWLVEESAMLPAERAAARAARGARQ